MNTYNRISKVLGKTKWFAENLFDRIFVRLIVIWFISAIVLGILQSGCSADNGVCVELDDCWQANRIATSDIWRSSDSLPESVRLAITKLLPKQEKFETCFRLSGGYIIRARRRYAAIASFYALDGGRLKKVNADNENFSINSTAIRVRYAPIVKPPEDRFLRLWDSLTKEIIELPYGYKGRLQCGNGVFLLEDALGKLYIWQPDRRGGVSRWPYAMMNEFIAGSFHLSTSELDGTVYAFVGGIVMVPNSAGAVCIECYGTYNGRQLFEIDFKDGSKRYYIYPDEGVKLDYLRGANVPDELVKIQLSTNGIYGTFINVNGAVKLL